MVATRYTAMHSRQHTHVDHDPLPPAAKKAARAAFFGFAVDYFDIYLPVVALAPALAYFQPPTLSSTTSTTIFYVTFALTLIARPVGAAIFGSVSDRIGRRRTTLIAVAGFTAATLAVAALPGYQELGFAAVIILMVLRFVGGVFMGGEYTSANPLAIESCPEPRRGFVGAVIASAYPVGYIGISLVTLPLLLLLPTAGVSSAYAQWGWRVPFLVGGILGCLVFWYFTKHVEESPQWQTDTTATTRRTPLRSLFHGEQAKRLAQVFVLMSGLWFAVQALISPTSALLTTQLGQDSTTVTLALLAANVALFFGYLGLGKLGQRYGRRTMLLYVGLATATIASGGFFCTLYLIASGAAFWPVMAIYALCLVIGVSPYGLAIVYLLEVFPTSIRSSGYGIAYSFSLIIPACYSFYMLGLATIMPYVYTPVVLLVLSGILTFIGAKLGPRAADNVTD